MADTFIPGTVIIEKGDQPVASTPGTSLSGMVLRTKRGLDSVVRLVTNLDQFTRFYGGPDTNHPYGYESARAYFKKGGNAFYCVRVLGAGSDAASIDLDTIDDTNATTVNIAASSDGAWGNNTFITTKKWATVLNAAVPGGGTTAQLVSISGVEIGDIVNLNDGVTDETHIVVAIDVPTKTITTRNSISAYPTPASTVVSCTSTHKTKTTLAQAIINEGSPTQITVTSAATVEKGALLLIVSSTLDRVLECRVDALNGNILSVTSLYSDGVTDIPAGSVVVSTNFDIIYGVDNTIEAYSFLALESENPVSYVETALAQTEFLRATVSAPAITTYKSFTYPEAVTNAFLTGGLDGAAPADSDYLGENVNKTYTHGVKLFDAVSVLPQLGTTSTATEVIKGFDAYVQNRTDSMAVAIAPLTVDTFDEAFNFRNVTLNLQSSYTALYGPWVKMPDPLTPGGFINVPPLGHVLGVYSETSTRRGTQKPPANELVVDAVDVVASFTNQEFGILNGIGFNLIRNVSGRGIRVASARTLWPNQDRKRWVNVRRILNAVKVTLRDLGVTVEQEPNDDILWNKIQQAGRKTLEDKWRIGWFYPRNNPNNAFYFRCDSVTNTEQTRLEGKVRSVVGINPVLPGELIEFELNLFSGGEVVINEL